MKHTRRITAIMMVMILLVSCFAPLSVSAATEGTNTTIDATYRCYKGSNTGTSGTAPIGDSHYYWHYDASGENLNCPIRFMKEKGTDKPVYCIECGATFSGGYTYKTYALEDSPYWTSLSATARTGITYTTMYGYPVNNYGAANCDAYAATQTIIWEFANDNSDVDVFTYVTEGTFDAYLYQLVENKQKFIGQIMTSKSPARSAEDVDEQALSYAEIKALAAGDPSIKEKMDLDVAVTKLQLLKASYLSQRYALEDRILGEFPRTIAQKEQRIAGFEADIATAAAHPIDKDHFPPMTVQGNMYEEKAAAGEALIKACKAMTSPEPIRVGSYRGFDLELSFDSFSKVYVLTLVGQLRHTVELGTDPIGNITRTENVIDGFGKNRDACREQLATVRSQLETARIEVQKPFAQENELTQKLARLAELNAHPNLDEKESVLLDGEPEEGEDKAAPEKSNGAR